MSGSPKKPIKGLWCPHCGEPQLIRNSQRTGQPPNHRCRNPECERQTVRPLKEAPLKEADILDRKLPSAKRYVITAAQNVTPVHSKFFKSLENYCNHNNAELIIIPLRYQNPTSLFTLQQKQNDYWDVPRDALYKTRADLTSNLTLLGDIKTQPTAAKPLTGFESIGGAKSGILGHPKLQMKCIPTPHHHLPKMMITTGVCTVANYSDTKAGKKGEFHHTLGALVVEIADDMFYWRHLNALKNGTFIDLWLKYTPEGVSKAPAAGGLIMGDTHVRFIDPAVERATFQGKDSIMNTLSPQALVWHDLNDNYSRNPHHRLNPFVEMAKRKEEMHRVREEMEEAIDFMRTRTKKGQRSIVVGSNHVDFMTRWIMDTDWRRDPDNAEFYLETALAMARSSKMTANGADYVDPFTYWAQKELDPSRFVFPARNQSYTIRGIEVNLHGDQGPNGARGSIEGFRRIGAKTIVGHSHTPGIEEGCYQVGTSTHLRLEYNEGPSSWLNTHCVIYANGKRALLNVIDGAWRIT